MRKSIVILLFAVFVCSHLLAELTFSSRSNLGVVLSPKEDAVVHTALAIFTDDYKKVFGGDVLKTPKGPVYIGTLGKGSEAEKKISKTDRRQLSQHPEGFLLQVINNKMYILGADKRGTAYGILELSRRMGVSPWVWWADATIHSLDALSFPDGMRCMEFPSVLHRGIFLNDEDWGLTPWSFKTNETSDVSGQIGPKTHARIFELLLRLRANTFWPAMHACSVAFYFTPGNKEMADKYGISIGTSHCEPMARNTNAEWKSAGNGEYDYVHNRENVVKFWEERVKATAGADNIYTLGIRGVHDGKMQGAKTVAEMKTALTGVIKDQREMLAKYVNKDLTKVPQVFIPYKEVLDVYKAGLSVPDDVTLMWCDDNYGYITHFPDSVERSRSGGNGVYYHISYWGRPHDYLWLATTHPALLYSQMKMAYEKGAKDLWIVNVGDIKPAEYLTELFLDMAWNIQSVEPSSASLSQHLKNWMQREFGTRYADDLTSIMQEYYRLAYIHKPEFMGNTRTEESDPSYKKVTDLPWSETEIIQRLHDYERIENDVMALSRTIPTEKMASWFELIEYPVRGASQMNKKLLYAQLARHGKCNWQLSNNAYDTIVALTARYNALENGKWKNMMDCTPRNLAVFGKVQKESASVDLPENKTLCIRNGIEYSSYTGEKPLSLGLGYANGAVHLQKNSTVSYRLDTSGADSLELVIALAPNHAVEGKQVRFAVMVNQVPKGIFNIETEGRSEEWKMNVLYNRSTRSIKLMSGGQSEVMVTLQALDEGIVPDQILLRAIK